MEEAGHTAMVPSPCCDNGDHDNQPGAVKALTEIQEGSRRQHDSVGKLDDQRPQPDEERGIHLVPP